MALVDVKATLDALEKKLINLSEDVILAGQSVEEEDMVSIRANLDCAHKALLAALDTASQYTQGIPSDR